MSNNQDSVLILAKSNAANRPPITLLAHSEHVLQCANAIFAPGSRLSNNWKRFFRLDDDHFDAFLLNLRVAALLHDIGKANADFLVAVTSQKFEPQAFRHEHISALLLFAPEMQKWLSSEESKINGLDFDAVVAAILSHHLKATLKSDENAVINTQWFSSARDVRSVPTYFTNADVKQLLERVRYMVGLSGETPTLPVEPIGDHAPYKIMFRNALERALRLRVTIPKDSQRNRLLMAVKTALIISDAAGSGLVRTDRPIEEWIRETLHQSALTSEAIDLNILRPRAKQVEVKTGKPFELKPFQKNIGSKGKRVLLLASCAAGKTMAAWKWAEQICNECSIGKVLFLYPTRGTATEGFRDYVGWAPETEIGLDHGTSQFELESIQKNPPESLQGKTLGQSPEAQKLYSLGMWGKRYLSATVDQFLAFLEFQYGSICKLPMLADAAIIIDEVHSFDTLMFGNLISFLKHFDLPVLCMTATLPPSRKEQLKEAGLEIYTANEDKKLREQSDTPRYRHQRLSATDDAIKKAVDAYQRGKRVLWVVNTVDRCQSIADTFEHRLRVDVLSYHSRFTLCDRQDAHLATVRAFQQEGQAAIAVTTQVCEMSLDLDAQVLITEDAPVPSLVQRMGRANRHLREAYAEVYSYKPEKHLPYVEQELHDARAFLEAIGNRHVSQTELADFLERYTSNLVRADENASLISSGYFAIPNSFRDTDEYALPCILDKPETMTDVEMRLNSRRSIEGFIVQVPRPDTLFAELNANRPAWLPRHIYLADHRHYDTKRGFRKERHNG
jgi:CRISPR-associated endonuclease/helicase Cas3